MLTVGSLCTGIAGLELGLQYAGIETNLVFVSDIDHGACAWLDQAMPHTPNLGDLTQLDKLPEVDILTAGFPCQPVSQAGLRKGINDQRWLFNDICRLVSRMESRPVLFLENVSGILTANSGDAMGRVVYGLADIGYHITWGTLSAAAVGAPHRRNRWWGLAQHPAGNAWLPSQPFGDPEQVSAARSHKRCKGSAAHPEGTERRGPQQQNLPATFKLAAESGKRISPPAARFGKWEAAVNRWECILGRQAPDPTADDRLNPSFVEWMMGYPEGWVTKIMTHRAHSLKALGNAVVPQCVAAAFTALAARM